jgi:hypothetical protein
VLAIAALGEGPTPPGSWKPPPFGSKQWNKVRRFLALSSPA